MSKQRRGPRRHRPNLDLAADDYARNTAEAFIVRNQRALVNPCSRSVAGPRGSIESCAEFLARMFRRPIEVHGKARRYNQVPGNSTNSPTVQFPGQHYRVLVMKRRIAPANDQVS